MEKKSSPKQFQIVDIKGLARALNISPSYLYHKENGVKRWEALPHVNYGGIKFNLYEVWEYLKNTKGSRGQYTEGIRQIQKRANTSDSSFHNRKPAKRRIAHNPNKNGYRGESGLLVLPNLRNLVKQPSQKPKN